MTFPFKLGALTVSLAASQAELAACQRLRHQCFFGREGLDDDPHDARCQHMMVRNGHGALVATARLLFLRDGTEIDRSFAAQVYELSCFTQITQPLVEVGRFCIAPGAMDADVLRVAWGALTRLIDDAGVGFLFGCSSFRGTDPAPYGRSFARLAARHQGPVSIRPRVKAPEVIPLAGMAATGDQPMPPLLRTYLAMGGWTGDHAVVDRHMGTMHVFTCVETAAVPPARARSLRALAQGAALS